MLQAVSDHADGYIRFRALTLLTGFSDPRTEDAMHAAMVSPNDRLREVAYAYFEHQSESRARAEDARRAREGRGRVRPAGA